MWGAQGGGAVGVEDTLQSSLRDTERGGGAVEGVEWRAKEWPNTKSTEQKRHGGMGLGDWMLKRDGSKEDLDWETERKQLGSELSSDAITELGAEKECEKQGERLITRNIGQ